MKIKTILTLTTALMITLPATAMAGDQSKWDTEAEKQSQMQEYKTMDKSASAMDQSRMDQSEMGMSAEVKSQQQAKAQMDQQKKPGQKYSQATIRNLQQALSERGYDAGPVDGLWGPRTASAVRSFQQARNMPVTGEPNANVMNELNVQAEMRGQMSQQMATRMQKDTIQDIQQSLRQAGFNPGPVDGIWGPRTASAVRDFQQENNLEATGDINQSTLDQLGVRTRG